MTGAWQSLREKLHGARRLEWMVLLVALSVAALIFLQGSDTGSEAKPTELEARLERVLSAVDGAGQVRAMITEGDNGVVGVVIVAEGAGQVRVRLSLMQAARALLNVELEKIEVIEMRGDEYAQALDVDGMLSCGAGDWRARVARAV